MFDAVDARVQATRHGGRSARRQDPALRRGHRAEAEARPHFPPIWFREIAEEGAHLDRGHDRAHRQRGQGARRNHRARALRPAGASSPINPLVVHAGIVGPLLLYFASTQMRRRLERGGVKRADGHARRGGRARAATSRVSLLQGRHVMSLRARTASHSGSRRCAAVALAVPACASGAPRRPPARLGLRRGHRSARGAAGRRPAARGRVAEGDRVEDGALIARLDTADAELALRRAEAERDQARCATAPAARPARAPRTSARRAPRPSPRRPTSHAAEAELQSADADLQRFEALLASNSGSRKQRDDAATRREVAASRLNAARERRVRGATKASRGCVPARAPRKSPPRGRASPSSRRRSPRSTRRSPTRS